MVKLFSKTNQFLGYTDIISLFQFIEGNTPIYPINQFSHKKSSKLTTSSTYLKNHLYISIMDVNNNPNGYFAFIVKNKNKEELLNLTGDKCLMISNVYVNKRKRCFVLVKSHFNLKDYITSQLLKDLEIDDSIDLMKIKYDNEIHFNPKSFYHYNPTQNDILDKTSEKEFQRFLPDSTFKEEKSKLIEETPIQVNNKVFDYKKEDVVIFYKPRVLNEHNFDFEFIRMLQKLVYLNPTKTKEEFLDKLWGININNNYSQDLENFKNSFNVWWNDVVINQIYISAPKQEKYFHFHPYANLSDKQKDNIVKRVSGLKRSIATIENILEIRSQNPNMKKTEVNQLLKSKVGQSSINTIRKYWDSTPPNLEEEVRKINLEYMDINSLHSLQRTH